VRSVKGPIRKAKEPLPTSQARAETSAPAETTVSMDKYEALVRKVQELEQQKRIAETPVATRHRGGGASIFSSKDQGKLLPA
jgi:hypothetical protein